MTKPLYFWNGSSFELVGPTTPQSPFAYQTSAPTAPATGDIWIDSDGDVDTYNRQLTRYYFVASAGQTSVSGTDANGLTLAYVAGSEQVYVNGALQVRGVDYTATNGTSITGLSALALNDVVEVFAYTAFTVANAYTKTETDSVAAAAPGLRLIIPTSVAVGSGSGSVGATGTVTFSAASSVSVNSCFSSTYDVYRIVFNAQPSGTPDLQMRYRVSGSDNTSASYNYEGFIARASGTNASVSSATNQTSFVIAGINAGNANAFSMDVYKPFNNDDFTKHALLGHMHDSTSYILSIRGGVFGGNTSFDGFTMYTSAGTMTGTIQIYGYKD